uniref:B30.2/SPRY domain-containing protein n=1 Tax=Poecilia reticulata TaxID=8081 RepID=A0A3P9Q9X1_POERE
WYKVKTTFNFYRLYGQRLKFSKEARSPSYELERFDLPMVFGKIGFTSGRHYWEVQVVIVKKENGFFSMGKSGFDYYVHCSPQRVLHLYTTPRNMGIYLDYEEGRVSFYDLDERFHIHSYHQAMFPAGKKMVLFLKFCLGPHTILGEL